MRQIRRNITEEFERDLLRLRRQKEITNESEASDFRSWLGLGLKGPLSPKPRLCSDDDLWS